MDPFDSYQKKLGGRGYTVSYSWTDLAISSQLCHAQADIYIYTLGPMIIHFLMLIQQKYKQSRKIDKQILHELTSSQQHVRIWITSLAGVLDTGCNLGFKSRPF